MYRNFSTFAFVLTLLVCFSSLVSHAKPQNNWQWHDTVFKNFTAKNGLPQGYISAIAQDHLGFIWLLTSEGLVRFDGTHFTNIPVTFQQQTLHINRFVHNNNWLWLDTKQGIFKFNPATREASKVALSDQLPSGIRAIAAAPNDNSSLWAATKNVVYKIHRSPLVVDKFQLPAPANAPNVRIFSLLSSREKTVWLGTSHGLFVKKDQDEEFSFFDLSKYLPTSQRISAIIQTTNGNIWVATPRSGVVIITPELEISQPKIPDFKQEWIFSLAQVSNNKVWLGIHGQGIIEVDLAVTHARRIRHNRLVDTSLPSNEVWKVFKANNGLMWVVSSKGLSLHNPNQNFVKSVYGDTRKSQGLTGLNVNSLAEDDRQNIWLGLRAKGVDIISPKTGLIKNIPTNPNKPETHLPGGAIETLALLKADSAIFGSNWGMYAYENGSLERMNSGTRHNEKYTGALYATIKYLWAGGTDGLWRFNRNGNKLGNAKKISVESNKFTDQRVSIIGEAKNNEILVGTWNGLNWVNSDGALTHTLPNDNFPHIPFDNKYISTFLYDDSGRLWVATEGSGLYIGDSSPHPAQFTQLTKDNGLSSNVIKGMQKDNLGKVWISTSAGIDVIDTKALSIQQISPHYSGLFAPYYRNANLLTSTGDILFGGSGGLTIIHPEHWQDLNAFFPLVLTKSLIGDKQYSDPFLGLNKENPLKVSPEHNKVSVEFTTLDFENPKDIHYRYRLIGLNEEWQEADAEHRVATYTTLPPGLYSLEIQNSNRIGTWNTQSQTINIQVLPFWYQTLWAKLLYVVTAIAVVIAVVRMRTISLNNRRRYLEEQIKLRTLSLEQTTKALEEKSEALAKASVTDPLTGLNNRRFLERNMPQEMALTARKYHNHHNAQQPIPDADLIFLLIDIDHFKQINDQHGHQVGDDVLIEFSERLKSIARESDYLVRWGGEEFLFVVRESSRNLASTLAQRICDTIEQTPFTPNHELTLNLTCSIGYLPFPINIVDNTATGWLECIDIADKALYTAKRAGRNAWVGAEFYASSPEQSSTDYMQSSISSHSFKLKSNLDPMLVDLMWNELHTG